MQSNNQFKQKYGPWALITGASSGIGVSFAEHLASVGLNLVLVARREDRLQMLADKLMAKYAVDVKVVGIDLGRADFLPELLNQTQGLEIGLLVNNAGFATSGKFLTNNINRELNMLYVNCRAPLILAHAYGQQMLERGRGGIVFLASVAAFMSVPMMSHYAATKAYNLLLGEGLSQELKKQGIDVLSVCPGETKTEFHDVASMREVMPMLPEQVVAIALKKLGRKPSVVTGVINFSMIVLLRSVPRRWVAKISGTVMDKAKKSLEDIA